MTHEGKQAVGVFFGTAAASRRVVETVKRAFAEFLTIPTLVIGGFLVLAVATYLLDEFRLARVGPDQGVFGSKLFSDPETASSLLGTIATSVITVSSITLSLLLIAVQQGAASLSNVVFDQFLRRRSNQFYFGSFLGFALYSLIILASVTPEHNPVYGVSLAFLMTAGALYMLIILIYTTIDQMRPVVIVEAIRDHILGARERQQGLLRQTRRTPLLANARVQTVRAQESGFLTCVNLPLLVKSAEDFDGTAEFCVLVCVGDYVAFRDPIAEIRTSGGNPAELEQTVRRALPLESQRDLDHDPAFGIDQLTIIGWTSGSTARSNPDPALLAALSLRDILARWVDTDAALDGGSAEGGTAAAVVYIDNVPGRLFRAFESLTVVASESMQHQFLSELYRGFAAMLPRLPRAFVSEIESLVLRSLSALGDHVPTTELDAALSDLATALKDSARPQAADAVQTAQARLAANIGRLNSRSTRAVEP